MKYKKFGNTGIDISVLGFGCMRFPEIEEKDGETSKFHCDYEKVDEMIRYAYENGVNYYDTAFYYCHEDSEVALGRAVKSFRDKIYISTKCPMEDVKEKGDYRKMLYKSLEKLDTDYVDFYHFWAINKKVFDEKIIGLGLLEEALKLKAEGKIRHISFSFHDHPKYIQEIIDESSAFSNDKIDVMESMLVQYNLLDRANAKGIDYAALHGMGVVAMGPVAGGRLAAPAAIHEKISGEEALADYDLALRYVIANENISCALSGMGTLEMVQKNVKALSNYKPPSSKERATIVRTRAVCKKFRELYCTGCAYCQPCPKKIEIPKIFEAYTMHNVYGLTDQAKETFAQYKENGGKTSDECADCGFCEKKCPQKLKIRELLKKVEKELG